MPSNELPGWSSSRQLCKPGWAHLAAFFPLVYGSNMSETVRYHLISQMGACNVIFYVIWYQSHGSGGFIPIGLLDGQHMISSQARSSGLFVRIIWPPPLGGRAEVEKLGCCLCRPIFFSILVYESIHGFDVIDGRERLSTLAHSIDHFLIGLELCRRRGELGHLVCCT